MRRALLLCVVLGWVTPMPLHAAEENASGVSIHVSPDGDDANPGTAGQPLASLAAAQRVARSRADRGPVTVWLHDGDYYLPETVRFTAEDSGTAAAPVTYAAAPGTRPTISGGVRLTGEWVPYRDGILQTTVPPDFVIDELFINGQRQQMARYPNFDPQARFFNGVAEDAIDPERVARWANPAGGYIHAMMHHLWGSLHWRIGGKKPDGSLDYEGGWQLNRDSHMHQQVRMVENIFEELDAPGEWFHDRDNNRLYCYPPADTDWKTAKVEIAGLRHLIEFNGTPRRPVRHITLQGLTFRHTARTFMETREPLLRSDWSFYRGAAIVFNGAEDALIEDCDFDQVGGNAMLVNNYNRRVTVRGCLIRESGATAVSFVGDPQAVRSPLFEYGQQFDYDKLDRTPGPIGENFPADCLVEDCLITRCGRFEKQAAGVQIAMARDITVRHCSIYDMPRAGINIGDGCWGGHVIEHCDVFDTVKETGDHGSFNCWGRDRYWHPDITVVDRQVAADPDLPFLDAGKPVILRNNRWRCDRGWDVDLDDGATNYEITNNVMLAGGLKLREGYRRVATNNVIVNNNLHPHVWYQNSGDVFTRNIVMGPYRDILMNVAHWGRELDRNLYTTSEADRTKHAARGCDANSIVADPLFVNPAAGDFRVRDGSPAGALGFTNVPMDQFGVTSTRLRSLARTPEIPSRLNIGTGDGAGAGFEPIEWQGATIREMFHLEFSAVGVGIDAGGVLVAGLAAGSSAEQQGIRRGDFIQRINDRPVRNTREFLEAVGPVPAGQTIKIRAIRNQQPIDISVQSVGDVNTGEPDSNPAETPPR